MKRKNKLYLSLCTILLITLTFLSGCSSKRVLLFLNWGEYINYEMVEAFEEEYDCTVIVDLADSNELFYAKVKSGTTAYDLVCPAEYMVQKMYVTGLLQPLYNNEAEKEKYFPNLKKVNFMPQVLEIEKQMNISMKEICQQNNMPYDYENNEINKYHMPYFWGTFGLMYNKKLDIFKDVATYNDANHEYISNIPDGSPDILQKNDAWKVYFFDDSLNKEDCLPSSVKVGQYNAVRFSYGAVMTYLDGNPNTKVENGIDRFKEVLSRKKYTEWGTDSLKHSIESHSIDLAFAYTGDCLDMAYLRFKDRNISFEELDFFTYTPQITMAHIDSLVIPKNARHADLAREFINFLLDPNNAWLNNRDIGYLPPLQEVYNMIINESGPQVSKDSYLYFELTDKERFWRTNWAKALKASLPREGMQLYPLTYFDTEDINELTNIVNNIKVSK